MAAFEHDFFISYAHLDDESLIEGEPGWVPACTGCWRSVSVKCWARSRGSGAIRSSRATTTSPTPFSRACPRSAALVRFSRRATCIRRGASGSWRSSAAPRSGRAGSVSPTRRGSSRSSRRRSRASGTPRRCSHARLRVLRRRPADRQAARAVQAYGPDAERAFLAKLDDLAYDIAKLLEMLQNGGGQPDAAAGAARATVYLAETSFDLREEREAIKRDLMRNGFEVLPDQPLPLVASELDSARPRAARPLQPVDPPHRRGTTAWFRKARRARWSCCSRSWPRSAAPRSGLSRLIWLPPGLEVEDERQRDFVQHLQTSRDVHAARRAAARSRSRT